MRQLFSLVAILCLSTSCVPLLPKKNSSITAIKTYSEIAVDLMNQDALILMDIDNTIFRSTTHYGSVEQFDYIFNKEIEVKNYTKAQVMLKNLARWKDSQAKISTKLIDEQINNFIHRAMINKAVVLAFTAREGGIADLTYNQLAKHHIFMSQLPGFSFKLSYKNKIFPDHEWCKRTINIETCANGIKEEYHYAESLFYRGILFAHSINTKGDVLVDFYNQYKSYISKNGLAIPKRIIFVDDKMYNLISMEEAASRLGLEFYGYHISDDFNFDPAKAQLEETKYKK